MSDNSPKVAACVLAAGCSSRMGEDNKLLCELQGKTVLQHVLAHLQHSAVDQTIVVTGHESKQICNSILNYNATTVYNENYSQGLSSSIGRGIESCNTSIEGVLIIQGDMPFIMASTIDKIIQAFYKTDKIIVPVYWGQDANPLLWPKRFFGQLLGLKGDRGAKKLLNQYQHQIHKIDIENVGIVLDIDDRSTMEMLRSKFNFVKGESYAN